MAKTIQVTHLILPGWVRMERNVKKKQQRKWTNSQLDPDKTGKHVHDDNKSWNGVDTLLPFAF